MNRIKILTLCLLSSLGFAQQSLTKTSQSIDVDKEVVVDLNTNYVEIEVDTWNKDKVEVEAYIESSKLSKEELEKALKAWNLKVEASTDYVEISSQGGQSLVVLPESLSYDDILKDLEFELADLPDVPKIMVIPEIPSLANFPDMPNLPDMPEMPEFPELPELPEGIKSISFDYDKYQKEGEKYLEKWSKKYEKEGGKELQKAMEKWAREFGDSDYQNKMEAWGEEYGKRFEGKWAKEMEAWGEKFGEEFGKDMEKWGEEFGEKFGEEWAEKMEAWGERFQARMERQAALTERLAERTAQQIERDAERKAQMTERRADLERRRAEMTEKRNKLRSERESFLVKRLESTSANSQVKKVIKLKIPKKAKLKLNVRHGELKVSSVIHNAKGNVSHTFLVAEHIDGSDTSINVSYSPVIINKWNLGTLNLNYVDKAQIKDATHLVLNSKSSNISIDRLNDTGIIDGSFGDLTISNLSESFKNLNLVLENSDALINLPTTVDYNLYFKGNRSKFNNKPTTQKTVSKDDNGQSANKTIVVNAKYSSVVVN